MNENGETIYEGGRTGSEILQEGVDNGPKNPGDKTIDEQIEENGWETNGGGIYIPGLYD